MTMYKPQYIQERDWYGQQNPDDLVTVLLEYYTTERLFDAGTYHLRQSALNFEYPVYLNSLTRNSKPHNFVLGYYLGYTGNYLAIGLVHRYASINTLRTNFTVDVNIHNDMIREVV